MAQYLFNVGIILIFYTSLSTLYTLGAKQNGFVLPFFLAGLLWSRQTGPQKNRTKADPGGRNTEGGRHCVELETVYVVLYF